MSNELNELQLNNLKDLSDEEKSMVMQILGEISNKGQSNTLDDLLYGDYAEIPVTIDQFLHDPQYLGKGLTNEEGKFTVFPYWEDTLKKIFPNNVDTMYNTLILSGAIGLGKSFVAVIAMLYMLYRMLCLKNPYQYYGLQPIDHITFSLMNITMDAAKGVAWSKIQELLQMSPWFMMHGHVSKSLSPEWQPNQNIELIYGSQPRHVIGRAVFCLDGETTILTDKGEYTLKDLVNKTIKVVTLDDNSQITLSNICTVLPTIITDEEYQIQLDNNYVIKCTADHLLKLKDGSYKKAKDLTVDDELYDFIK